LNLKAKYSKDLIRKASSIKAIFCDVDGVLTNGRIIYDDAGYETKQFHIRDSVIIPYLKKAGVLCGIISGRESEVVKQHAAISGMDFCHQGILDTLSVVEKLARHHHLKSKEVAFIGVDINELKVFRYAGLSVCPSDAVEYIQAEADWVTEARGGRGVLREVADLVLASSGVLEKILKP